MTEIGWHPGRNEGLAVWGFLQATWRIVAALVFGCSKDDYFVRVSHLSKHTKDGAAVVSAEVPGKTRAELAPNHQPIAEILYTSRMSTVPNAIQADTA